ncbi:MAG: aspartate--ammonia ligase [Oligoflexia bacterium]|nr:aspartate--ammonia ligase [Oligoflexia bacterium]
MQKNLILQKNYKSILDLKETEKGIRYIKEFFQVNLSDSLNLLRVSAPLFVKSGTGINDDLNGIEKPVGIETGGNFHCKAEIVQSLAKWKRMILKEYAMNPGEGIYTDMNAIRPDEHVDNLHSIYVDQWDWERIITKENRNLDFLKYVVKKIYNVLRRTEINMYERFLIKPILPEEITFIHTEELEKEFPKLLPSEREKKAAKKYGAIFVIGIGADLKNGKPHDGRAPDYDDWTTVSDSKKGYKGLNGDIIVWNPILEQNFEISSMGIRVDQAALLKQLKLRNAEDRKKLMWHKRLLDGELPLTIGGGIGQSRLCMFFLRKAHVGEVQCSIWPEEMRKTCIQNKIFLL